MTISVWRLLHNVGSMTLKSEFGVDVSLSSVAILFRTFYLKHIFLKELFLYKTS